MKFPTIEPNKRDQSNPGTDDTDHESHRGTQGDTRADERNEKDEHIQLRANLEFEG